MKKEGYKICTLCFYSYFLKLHFRTSPQILMAAVFMKYKSGNTNVHQLMNKMPYNHKKE